MALCKPFPVNEYPRSQLLLPTWTLHSAAHAYIFKQEAGNCCYSGQPLTGEVKCVPELLTEVATSLEFWVVMARVGLPVGTLLISASRVVVTGTLASPVAVADNT